ncbi:MULTISPECIES: hypothetical protein [Streptomyces]|uniref:hypothetical protein n=1 Tax=Streptomyces TaxID=1883 RepID=UPI0036C3410A
MERHLEGMRVKEELMPGADGIEGIARHPEPMSVPAWLMRPFPYVHRMVTTSMRVSNARVRSELGWARGHADCAEGLRVLAGG